MRSGCGVFPISVRNSPAAVAHLLTKMSVAHLLIGPEPQYQELAASALKLMNNSGTPIPETSTMLMFTDIFKDEDEPWEPLPEVKLNWDDVALVQHSSGEYHRQLQNDFNLTSAHRSRLHRVSETHPLGTVEPAHLRPLAMYVSRSKIVDTPANCCSDYHERELTGMRLACHAIPMFHGMGMAALGWALSSGLILTAFKPRFPVHPPVADDVLV